MMWIAATGNGNINDQKTAGGCKLSKGSSKNPPTMVTRTMIVILTDFIFFLFKVEEGQALRGVSSPVGF